MYIRILWVLFSSVQPGTFSSFKTDPSCLEAPSDPSPLWLRHRCQGTFQHLVLRCLREQEEGRGLRVQEANPDFSCV